YAPEKWEATFSQQIWPRVKGQLLQIATSLTQASALANQLPNPIWYQQIQADLAPLQTLLETNAPTYDTVRSVLISHEFAAWSRISKGLDGADKDTKNAAKDLRDAAKKTWQNKLAPTFALAAEQIGDLLREAQPLVATLANVALKFEDALTAEKAARHVQ
ncbi:helicase-exonuclease AddAB subunit AddA, partial [Lacticaseibacillus paracasei]